MTFFDRRASSRRSSSTMLGGTSRRSRTLVGDLHHAGDRLLRDQRRLGLWLRVLGSDSKAGSLRCSHASSAVNGAKQDSIRAKCFHALPSPPVRRVKFAGEPPYPGQPFDRAGLATRRPS